MGTYVNPGNDGFAEVLRDRYVDKTGLISLVNRVVETPRKLVCVTRPRRFGKSFAVKSLVAYYSCGCDSREMFEGLDISRDGSFEQHLNAYNVVRLDMTAFTGTAGAEVVPEVIRALGSELAAEFPETKSAEAITDKLIAAASSSGRKFVFVIDEWDAVFREAAYNAGAQERYVKFLRLLFKNGSFTDEVVAAAYITGILPIKRYGTQSAMTDFREYTMVDPADYALYVGFTEHEVEALSDEYGMGMEELRRWYDGYGLAQIDHVYAPYSVMEACHRKRIGPYWSTSETFEVLRDYIDMDFDGLQGDIVRAIGGEQLQVKPEKFQNDMTSINGKDDVLSLLIHLGYLAYDEWRGTAHVPNEEVRREFRNAVEESRHPECARIVRDSARLLRDVLARDEAAVAGGFQRAHDATCAPLFYNDEQALRSVVRAALIAASDDYARIEELPSGRGFADIAYLPRRRSSKPALLVELKWNKPAHAALEQIRNRNYPAVLRDLGTPMLLVGVSYDADSKAHSCTIEKLDL